MPPLQNFAAANAVGLNTLDIRCCLPGIDEFDHDWIVRVDVAKPMR